jgi:hypothetical protein
MNDTLNLIDQFKNTLAMMHSTMVQMEPIVERQLEVIASQRLIANIMFLLCFAAAFSALVFSLKSAQNCKSIWNIHVKKRWLGTLVGTFAVSLFLFNIIPGIILMNMDQQISSITADYSKHRLFSPDTLHDSKGGNGVQAQ